MLTRRQRSAILELHAKKFTTRRIAKALQISRPTVKDVIDSNSCEVPVVLREEKAEPYRQQILDEVDLAVQYFLELLGVA